MFTVGLTGGIGSGKSTFARLLEESGAIVVDADQIGRDALQPGQPAWRSVVETFGDDVLVPGSLDVDRRKLAGIVFSDQEKLAALNAIVHPVIFKGIANTLEVLSGTDEVVVIDAALLIETGLVDVVDVVVVVDASEATRRERLVRDRKMTASEVDARVRTQLGRAAILGRADVIVQNEGSESDLRREAERVIRELRERKA